MSYEATPKQHNFIKNLFADASKGADALLAAGKADLVASFAERVEPVEDIIVAVLQNKVIDGNEASRVITILKAVVAETKAALAPPPPAGLAALNADRIIPNRFAKACRTCGTTVVEGSGYAVLTKGGWNTYCHACAHTTPEERAAQVQAETAARQAQYAAERAAREAAWEAERRAAQEIRALAMDLRERAGVAGQANPKVRVALPSATGNNDLDFFKVSVDRHFNPYVSRVIGGHADQRLDAKQSVDALVAMALTEDIPAAMALFGQELGFCGRCGRHLTDEDSRAVGIGPDCQKLTWGF